MKEGLAATRCAIHAQSMASARCTGCRRFFCSECVTEHSGKFTCAACLETTKRSISDHGIRGRLWDRPVVFIQAVIAMILVTGTFYLIARLLGSIPEFVHDGTIWE